MKVNNSRILRLDLTHREIQFEYASRYADYIGGRGINQYLLFHEMPMGVSPLEPSSLLAIGAGLLCGTEAPGAVRLSIDTKNLFTGGIGSSNVGGNFGPALKRAGISNVIISGRSPELSYVKIDNGRVEICDRVLILHC